MKDYLFILTSSNGNFHNIHLIKLDVAPKLNDIFELWPNFSGKYRIVDHKGSIGEYGKMEFMC